MTNASKKGEAVTIQGVVDRLMAEDRTERGGLTSLERWALHALQAVLASAPPPPAVGERERARVGEGGR